MCLAPGAQARFWPAGAAAPARLWPAGITEALHLAVFGPPSAWRCSPGHCYSIPGQAHSDDRQCSQGHCDPIPWQTVGSAARQCSQGHCDPIPWQTVGSAARQCSQGHCDPIPWQNVESAVWQCSPGHCDPIPGQPISRMQAARQRRQRQQASRLLQAARGTSLWAGTGVRRPGRRPRLEQSPQSTPEPTPSLPRSQPASQAAGQPASQTAAPEQSPQLTPEPTPSQPRSQPEPGPVALSAHQLPAVASATPDRRGPSAPTADHHNTFEGRNFSVPGLPRQHVLRGTKEALRVRLLCGDVRKRLLVPVPCFASL